MGTTFSNLHIKKSENFTLDDFKKFFSDYMIKKGYKAVENKEQSEVTGGDLCSRGQQLDFPML